MMAAHQPITLDHRYCQLPGAHPPHPRNAHTVVQLRRALASLETIANIRSKARKV
jgi:hypothetical protein